MSTTRATGPITRFIETHYRHFNAATVVDAARGWTELLDRGGRMLVTLAGAMSTAELGKSLAEMIRQGKVHGISCTGANLEEDVFNLVAHDHYERVPHYRTLSTADEQALYERHLNRVTDTCIPEEEAMRRMERAMLDEWMAADQRGRALPPARVLLPGAAQGCPEAALPDRPEGQLDGGGRRDEPADLRARLGGFDPRQHLRGALHRRRVKNPLTVRSGIEYMIVARASGTRTRRRRPRIGFFQIGGGIAGDFPICVVPMLHQDLRREHVPLWAYFCQISDSTTSYGSYSGAVPNEKITWGKLRPDTPKFIIESDATIVAPLIFAHVLGW